MMKEAKCQVFLKTNFKKVKEYRKQAGFSQCELASIIGVRQATISNWENGVNFPTPDNIKKMAEAFKVDPSQFERDIRVWYAVRELQKLKISKEDILCLMSV